MKFFERTSKKELNNEKKLKYERKRQQYAEDVEQIYGIIKKYKRGVVNDLSKIDTKKERNDYRLNVNEEMSYLFPHYDFIKAKLENMDYLLGNSKYKSDYKWEIDSNGVSVSEDIDSGNSDDGNSVDDDSVDDENEQENKEGKGEDDREREVDTKEYGEFLALDRARYEFGNLNVKSKNEYDGCEENFVNGWRLETPSYLQKSYYRARPKSLHQMKLRNKKEA
jgi:hypothetical protein